MGRGWRGGLLYGGSVEVEREGDCIGCRDCLGTVVYSLVFPGIPRFSLVFPGIPWYSLVFPGIPCYYLFFGIPWYSIVFPVIF